jgi:Rieske Fe-S protein
MTRPLVTTPSPARLDRREFLCAAGLALAACLPACASVLAIPVFPENGRIVLRFLQHPALLERGGHLRLRPEGTTEPIYVLALDDGEYTALSPICTHQGCTVDISGDRLICPCHGSTYDRRGVVLRGPAPQALRRYPVMRTEDALIIELGAGA